MKILFATYCMGGADEPAAYIRSLHVALALHEQGHEIIFLCPGREQYHSPLTERGEARLTWIDLPFRDPTREWAETVRQLFGSAVSELAPDAIVVGEAPLGGPLLGVTLAGAERGVPLIVLDAAPSLDRAQLFHEQFGAMFDSLVLSTPESARSERRRWRNAPAHLQLIPPFATPYATGAPVTAPSQQAADVIVRTVDQGLRDVSDDCAQFGFTPAHLMKALVSQQKSTAIQLRRVRVAQLRTGADFALYAVVCTFAQNGALRSTRFWGRRYRSAAHLQRDLQAAAQEGRRIYHAAAADALLLEADLGAAELPPLRL